MNYNATFTYKNVVLKTFFICLNDDSESINHSLEDELKTQSMKRASIPHTHTLSVATKINKVTKNSHKFVAETVKNHKFIKICKERNIVGEI